MTQQDLMYYMKDKILPDLNNQTEKFIENIIEKNDDQISELNEIVEVRYGNEIYKTWKVKFIRPKITKFFKGKYPYSLIAREINNIDSTVFDNQSKDIIPVEIQKSTTSYGKFTHAVFEKSMRTQIDINIETYDKCWLFIDSEYLRFLQSGNVGKRASVDMTWLVRLMRENTLKVFTIKYDGTVKELITKDFDFLKNMSQMCEIGYDNDERVLNRNKLKIFYNVINGYNFTQEEITQFESEFDNRIDEKERQAYSFYINSENKKCMLYGNITHTIGSLLSINNNLSCTTAVNENKNYKYGVTLGIFHQNDFYGHNRNARIQFVDKFNIAQYFPGYLRNKEMWDYCKNKYRIFTIPEFIGIIEGREHCLKLIKNQSKSLLDYD